MHMFFKFLYNLFHYLMNSYLKKNPKQPNPKTREISFFPFTLTLSGAPTQGYLGCFFCEVCNELPLVTN